MGCRIVPVDYGTAMAVDMARTAERAGAALAEACAHLIGFKTASATSRR